MFCPTAQFRLFLMEKNIVDQRPMDFCKLTLEHIFSIGMVACHIGKTLLRGKQHMQSHKQAAMFMFGAASSGKSHLLSLLADAFQGKQIDAIQGQSDFQPLSIMNADIIYTNEWNSKYESLFSERSKQIMDATQPTVFRVKFKDNFTTKKGQMFIMTTNKDGSFFQDILMNQASA
jgi:hypothetical protein